MDLNPLPTAALMTFVIAEPPICSLNRREVRLKAWGQKGRQKMGMKMGVTAHSLAILAPYMIMNLNQCPLGIYHQGKTRKEQIGV